jgi:hypothetical protein
MKGVLPWLVRLARRAGTRDFCLALAAIVSPVQNILSPHCTLFLLLLICVSAICMHRRVFKL